MIAPLLGKLEGKILVVDNGWDMGSMKHDS